MEDLSSNEFESFDATDVATTMYELSQELGQSGYTVSEDDIVMSETSVLEIIRNRKVHAQV